MRSTTVLLTACCVTLLSSAAEPGVPLPVMSEPIRESGWTGFSLLPKAFQSNPQLEMTYVGELTDFGRTLTPPTPEHPVYYVTYNTGYRMFGDTMGDNPPKSEYLDKILRHSLSKNSYLPATRKHPPQLALIFHWGAHNAMDFEMRSLFPHLSQRHILERSYLVGGHKFRKSIADRLAYGDFPTYHTTKNEFLTYQASLGLYFAVVSAYDMAAFQEGTRRLVWRASMTVNTTGVSMVDSLPALILSAAPAFGRDMTEPDIVLRRVRRGVVEYGPATVVETDVELPAPTSD